MKRLLIAIILFIFFSCGSSNSSKEIDPLKGTHWIFIGFSQADSISRFPKGYNFKLQFLGEKKLQIEAFGKYKGFYALKGSKISIDPWISISYDSNLDTLRGGASLAISLKRVFQSCLQLDQFVDFEVNKNELKLPSKIGTMIFTRLNDSAVKFEQ